MDIVLHLGAHRTGTTGFQSYLRDQRPWLADHAIGFWGPWRTRKGLFNGLIERAESRAEQRLASFAAERVRTNLDMSRSRGLHSLLISEENVLGSVRRNTARARLYPDAGPRVARLARALGHIDRIQIQIRGLEFWWASAFAYLLPRGGLIPHHAWLDRIAYAPRSWQDVIRDIAHAAPGTDLRVTRHEDLAGAPDQQLAALLDMATPATRTTWMNPSDSLPALRDALAMRGEPPARLPAGTGRWMPFDAAQIAALRSAYAKDMTWLRSGADGLATLTPDTGSQDMGKTPARSFVRRGRNRYDRLA